MEIVFSSDPLLARVRYINSLTRFSTPAPPPGRAIRRDRAPCCLAQCAQQYIEPFSSTPCPRIRQPQCAQVGARGLDRTFEAIEGLRPPGHHDLEGLVIVETASGLDASLPTGKP